MEIFCRHYLLYCDKNYQQLFCYSFALLWQHLLQCRARHGSERERQREKSTDIAM